MMNLSDFLTPVDVQAFMPANGYAAEQLGAKITCYQDRFPDLDELNIALIAVAEERHAVNNAGVAKGADAIRQQLYQLYEGSFSLKMADLGTIKPGASVKDTYVALQKVMDELISKGIMPLILGGSHDLTFAQYMAYQSFEKKINMAIIDAYLDVDLLNEQMDLPHAHNYLNSIFTQEPNYLFNYSAIGYQTYFVPQQAIQLMNKLYFDSYRLGEVRMDITEMEPILRESDLLSIDITAIKSGDAAGNKRATPNGFSAEEICQLCRYAGISDKLSSFGIYEYNVLLDSHKQTALLIAEMLWCFIDAYYQRKKEHPMQQKEAFLKYVTENEKGDYEIVFYKSKKTEKWWMQVPSPKNAANERSYLTPCTYKDYQTAVSGELPDRWWKVQQKLM